MISGKRINLRTKVMNKNKTVFRIGPAITLAGLLASVTAFTSCGTMPGGPQTAANTTTSDPHSTPIVLREGDVVKVTFPGSPTLDTTEPIRRDGKLNLPLIGEVDASGMSPSALQDKLVQAYASQISSKEVIVQVASSSFPVYVTGAVMHPGKVSTDHPMTALEAVMEAGGFNYDTANMKEVKIDRNENGLMKHYTVDLKSILTSNGTNSFYLQPGDIIYVPERFTPV